MNVQDFCERLEGVKKTGSGWQARCPGHDDRNASLSITEGEDGKILMKCHAGCETRDVVAAAGLTLGDIFPAKPEGASGRKEIVAQYPYHDESGKLLFEVVRMSPKDFRQRRPDGNGGWDWSVKGIRRVIYRLPAVIEAIKQGQKIFIVEGEKDVAAMEKRGIVATCNPGGAGKWQGTFSDSLKGADCTVIADKDTPGRNHAWQVAASLKGKAKSVRVVEAPDKDGKCKDAADLLASGGETDDLIEIPEPEKYALAQIGEDLSGGAISIDDAIDALKTVKSASEDTSYAKTLSDRCFNPDSPPKPARRIYALARQTICTPGNLTTLSAKAKVGKSAVVGALIAAATGQDGDTLAIDSLNSEEKALIHFDTEQSPADHHLLVATALFRVKTMKRPPWLRSYRVCDVSMDSRFGLLEFELERANRECGGIHSVILDGIADLVSDPNNPEESFAAVERLHGLAVTYDTAIICVLHVNPGSEIHKTRGHLGSQLERKAETNLNLKRDGNVTTIFSTNSRHASVSEQDGPRFQWDDSAMMHTSCQTQNAEKTTAIAARRNSLAIAVYGTAITYTDGIKGIMEHEGVKRRQAETLASELNKSGLITKDSAGFWRISR